MSAVDNQSLPAEPALKACLPSLSSTSCRRAIGQGIALLVIALVYLYRLDRPLLWGDEADTGIAARNILRCGYPLEYDGRNLSVFQNGAELNQSLVRIKVSWVQFYLGAVSLGLFGNHTGGLRVLFALVGVLAFFPLHAILKSRVKCPAFITTLILTAPQIVLFQRNARYYPILILLYAVLLWLVSGNLKRARVRWVITPLVLVFMFHTQSFAALCCGVSLVAFSALCERESLVLHSVSSGIGFLSWVTWREMLGPPILNTALPISLITSDFAAWLRSFGTGLLAMVVDLEVVNCLPILLWIAAAAVLLWRGGRGAMVDMVKQPLPALILLNLLIQGVATAALFGSETGTQYALLRYLPHLLVFALASGFVVLDAAISSRRLYLPVCLAAVSVNLFSFSFWAKPFSREVPLSWYPPVYSEVFKPPVNPWDVVVAKIRQETPADHNRDCVIAGLPAWTAEVLIFYLGDSYLIPPPLDEAGQQSVRTIIGEESFRRFCAQPEWIVDMLGFLETAPPGYVTHTVVPSYRVRPDDGTRPELTRHTFPQRTVVGQVNLFRVQR